MWSKRFGDADQQLPTGLAVDAAGAIALTGYFKGTVDFRRGPAQLWSHLYNTVSSYSLPAFTGTGDLVLRGMLQSTANFGGGNLTTAGLSDAYVAKFSP